MEWRETARVLWRRRWLLLLAVVIGAAAAAPFAMRTEPIYTSTVNTLVPVNSPIPGSAGASLVAGSGQISVLALRLEEYLKEDLESDIRRQLGDRGPSLQSVSATQGSDANTYRVTATADTARVATDAVRLSATALINEGDQIAQDLVDVLGSAIDKRVTPLQKQAQTLRAEQQELLARINQLSTRRAIALRDENTSEDLSRIEEELDGARSQEAGVTIRLELLQRKIESLTDLEQASEASRVLRTAAATILGDPTDPSNGRLRQILLTEAIATLAGLLAGVLLVLLFRRRDESAVVEGQEDAEAIAPSGTEPPATAPEDLPREEPEHAEMNEVVAASASATSPSGRPPRGQPSRNSSRKRKRSR